MHCPSRELFSDNSSDESCSEPDTTESHEYPAPIYKKKNQSKTAYSPTNNNLNPQRLASPDDKITMDSNYPAPADPKNRYLPDLRRMNPQTNTLASSSLTNEITSESTECASPNMESSLLDSSVPAVATEPPSSATPPALDFPLSKILFIFEKMNSQRLSIELVSHATKLVCANKDKILRASNADVSQLMNLFMKKELFEEALSQPSLFEMSRTAILILTEAPDYLVPAAFYHRLLEELDMGSYQDYPGLGSILRSFALLPSSDKDEGVENQRLTLMTMTYSLLGVWPGSSDIGAALFRSLFVRSKGSGPEPSVAYSVRKIKLITTINLVLRVLAGDAQNGEVDVHAASRVVGNLLNVSEAATRQAVMQELNHLVSYSNRCNQKMCTGNHAESEFQRLPGQVGEFLIHLTALTHDKGDKRLDMVGLLGRILEDHLIAYSGGSEVRLGSRAIRLVLTTLPLDCAAELTRDVMLNSSSAHIRSAILGTLLKVCTGSISQGSKNNDAVLALSLRSDGKARRKILDLLMLFLAEDPVEKVRIACLEAIEILAAFFNHTDKETQSRDDSKHNNLHTPLSSISKQCALSILPGKVLALLVIKLGDVSLKVQSRAAAILTCSNDEGKISHIENSIEHGKETTSSYIVGAPRPALAIAFDGLPPQFKSEIAYLIFSLEYTSTGAFQQKFCPAAQVLLKQLVSQIKIPYLQQFNAFDQRLT